jgi:hypothetical protein
MRRILTAVLIVVLLLMGIALLVGGIMLVSQSRGEDDPTLISVLFVFGGSAVVIGLLLCVAAVAVSSWQSRASAKRGGDQVYWKSYEVYCRRCGSELMGRGGPCRKCDDVETRLCSSCSRYTPADRACVYCGADPK